MCRKEGALSVGRGVPGSSTCAPSFQRDLRPVAALSGRLRHGRGRLPQTAEVEAAECEEGAWARDFI